MLSLISSVLTASLNWDEIEDGENVLQDPMYLTQIIGFTAIMEFIVEAFLLFRFIKKKK